MPSNHLILSGIKVVGSLVAKFVWLLQLHGL